MWPVSRSLSWSTWCRLARWEDSLAGSCKPSLSCLSCLCVISWTECWREEVQPGTGEDTESRTCLADVTVTGPLVWQLSSVSLLPPLSRTPPLIGHNTHPVDQSGPMGVADTSFHIKPYFQKRSWWRSWKLVVGIKRRAGGKVRSLERRERRVVVCFLLLSTPWLPNLLYRSQSSSLAVQVSSSQEVVK